MITKEEFLDSWLALTGRAPLPDRELRLPMLSGSMLPMIPVGAELTIDATAPGACRRGDVIVWRNRKGELVAHRVLGRLDVGSLHLVFEKGDANPVGRWIRRSRVLGIVTRVTLEAAPGEAARSFSPCSADAARSSLRAGWRNFLLAGPRRLRRRLRGPSPTTGEESHE